MKGASSPNQFTNLLSRNLPMWALVCHFLLLVTAICKFSADKQAIWITFIIGQSLLILAVLALLAWHLYIRRENDLTYQELYDKLSKDMNLPHSSPPLQKQGLTIEELVADY